MSASAVTAARNANGLISTTIEAASADSLLIGTYRGFATIDASGVLRPQSGGDKFAVTVVTPPAPDSEPQPNPDSKIVLNDGTVVGADSEVDFSFEGDRPAPLPPGVSAPMGCPEVNNRPTYRVKGKHYFIHDKKNHRETTLQPGQSVSWMITKSQSFTWDVGGGAEWEAGIIFTKAKAKLDTKLSKGWTWSDTITLTDVNKTSKPYIAALGSSGWKLTTTKEWYARPCTLKKKIIVVKAPREGNISIGRIKL